MQDRSSEMRRDLHHGGWVLFTKDAEREQLLALPKDQWPVDFYNVLEDPEAAGAVIVWSLTSDLPDGSTRRVRVIANRFPLYRVEGQEDRKGVGIYDMMRGLGAHEIIIESDQVESLHTMNPHHYALTLQAFHERMRDLRKDERLRSITIFREWRCGNKGTPIHPHSQLIASAIIPLGLKNELDAAHEHYKYKERCIFCDMINQELRDQERLVNVTDKYITYCPFASRYPFEVHLFPRKHCFDFINQPVDEFPELASMIRDTACRLEEALPGWEVLMVLHNAPVTRPQDRFDYVPLDFHWHIEFLPQPPGFLDWFARTGTHVECTPPEKAASYLRNINVPSA